MHNLYHFQHAHSLCQCALSLPNMEKKNFRMLNSLDVFFCLKKCRCVKRGRGTWGLRDPSNVCGVVCPLKYISFGADVAFPNDYPSGCLLGCVDVTDCLSQEQFNEQVSAVKPLRASVFWKAFSKWCNSLF